MIKNKKLKEFLTMLLNKPIAEINDEDLQSITSVRISTLDINEEHSENFNDLQYLSNLNRIVIADSLLTATEIVVLSSIKTLISIEFEHCAFESDALISELNQIQSLTFNNCLIRDYSFLKTLVKLIELQIINPYDETPLDLYLLKKIISLKKLVLERISLTGLNLFGLPALEELSVLNTQIDNFHFINKCPKLSTMFISEEYLENPVVKSNFERIVFKTNFMEYGFEEPTK